MYTLEKSGYDAFFISSGVETKESKMDAYRRAFIKLSAATAVWLLAGGCEDLSTGEELHPNASEESSTPEGDKSDPGKSDQTEHPDRPSPQDDTLSVALYPDDTPVEFDTRQIILKFNKAIEAETLEGTISLNDKKGRVDGIESLSLDPDDARNMRVRVKLRSDFQLRESWRYRVVVTRGLCSKSGDTLPDNTTLVFHTSSQSPFESTEKKRSKIIVISDLHLNEERADKNGYSLFTENGQLLLDFLEQIRVSTQIRELVILGDLMDMWVVPMSYSTYHDTISDAESYFVAVSQADINHKIIDKINQIADEGKILFSYVPGNHDMLFNETIFRKIFPSGVWKGVEPGTGRYYPESSVVLEHGHNYDLFNAPDSVTTGGSLLPPGYFITRVYATGNLLSTEKLPMPEQNTKNMSDQLIYTTSWDIAVHTINIPNFDPDKVQIVTGVDGYTGNYSSNGARDIYTSTIGSDWKERQKKNGVAVPSSVIVGIMNGSGKFFWFGTLEYSAVAQYFTQNHKIDIVVFGHTHHAMLKQDLVTLEKIYANSGTWIDSRYLNDGALTGTCVVLNTAASSGSELENATLYQAVRNDLGDLTLKKIDEKSLEA